MDFKQSGISLEHYQFHFDRQGDQTLPVLLLLHGFMGNCQDFEPAIAHLSQDFCCLAVDLPGHGLTRVFGGEECYTMPQTAQALVDWLEQMGIAECCLLGYSLGGRLALYLSLNYFQKFPKVILESASPGLKTEAEREQRRHHDEQLAQELETGDFHNFVTNWYNQPLFASLRKQPEFAQLLARRSCHNPQELARSLRNMGTGSQPSLWQKLKQNQVPLLLLVGEADLKFQAINREMASHCPTAQLQIVQGCGHNIHLEAVTTFVTRVRDFLLG